MPELDRQVVSKAKASFQRVSARKARLIADLIRGRSVHEARQILQFTHRAIRRADH